jgi:arylsulfatase A-like enzyme
MLGPGIRAGWYTAEATPADVVPTLAHLLGVEPPEGADGRVLTEALQSP